MDQLRQIRQQVARRLFALFILVSLLTGFGVFFAQQFFPDNFYLMLVPFGLGIVVVGYTCARSLSNYAIKPLGFLQQALNHIAPENSSQPAPNAEQLRLGHDLVTPLAMQIYKLASLARDTRTQDTTLRKQLMQATNIVSHLPLPMFVFNKDQQVTSASDSALQYFQLNSTQLFGTKLYETLNFEFSSQSTLETWIADCQKNKVTDNAFWQRVRVQLPGEEAKKHQCDMVASYNRDNPSGTEFIVVLFDRTGQYNQEDESLSFISLAVHELRTPLTVLRGYIEVFEEELASSLTPEMSGFMHKMQASAESLTTFVSNILNVARIEDNQLTLDLSESNWAEVLKHASADMELRAQVHGKTIIYNIAENLPTVAVDRVSIYEVVGNILDNAIKYSGASNEIVVTSKLDRNGLVETTITDKGVGIPESVLPNLFEKFYRNHRTRGQVGGTGLGLYLSRAIIQAHGGQIWAQSKEGQGSTFGFTLLPYTQLAKEGKTGDNKSIVRQAHGWIKNHSIYRR